MPVRLLRDLIDAFCQDVTKKRYATFAELMDYARRSANPVGRLLLHLFEKTGDRPRFPLDAGADSLLGNRGLSPVFSDHICSALQLINFWQDVAIDWKKGRVYIPQEDLARFGVAEEAIAQGAADARWRAFMAFECDARAGDAASRARRSGRALPGRIGLEIRATVEGRARDSR